MIRLRTEASPSAKATGDKTARQVFSETLEVHRHSFLESLRVRSYAKVTLESRSQGLDTFFRFLSSCGVDDHPSQGDPALDVREVTRQTVQEYQLWLMAHRVPRTGQPFTTYTLHAKLMALRMFFEHLEKTSAILINPCEGLVLPRLKDRLPRAVLTPAEARGVLDAPDTQTFKGIRDKAILELFYSTGIRLEEMSRLSIYDVDFRNGFVRVNKGKFAKDRVVPMGRKASAYVKEYLQKVRFEWSQNQKDERALWLSYRRPHAPLKKQLIGVMVRQYGKAAGIGKRLTPHVWRHTCATHLVSAGSPLAHVQRLLGHRSVNTTQIYSRVTGVEIKASFERSHPRAQI